MFALPTILLSVAVVEGLRALPLAPTLRRVAALAGRARWVLGASDHWKQRALLICSGRLLAQTARLALALAPVLLGAGAALWAGDGLMPGFAGFVLSPAGLALSCLAACGYAWGRARV
ncbi:MAG: hypothetical protein ACP5DX_18405 [Paracoccaceae bacterium]